MSKREFSKISPAVWQSGRFTALDTDARILHLYYLSCQHQNSAGCFRLPDGYASTDLSWEPERYRRCRDGLVEAGLISFDNDTCEVFVHRWFKHNPPMNDKHATGTIRIIERIESDEIREKVQAEFQAIDEHRQGKGAQDDSLASDARRLMQSGVMKHRTRWK